MILAGAFGVNASLPAPTIENVELTKTPTRAFRTGGSPDVPPAQASGISGSPNGSPARAFRTGGSPSRAFRTGGSPNGSPITTTHAAKPLSNRSDASNDSPIPPMINISVSTNPPMHNDNDKPERQSVPEENESVAEKPNKNSVLDESTPGIVLEGLLAMFYSQTEKPAAQNSNLDESATDIECEVLDTMDVSNPVPELPIVEFESVNDLIKDFEGELELDEDLRFHLFTKTFKRVISTNEKDLIDNPTYNLYYEKLTKQVKPYSDRLDSIANFARDISAEILSISGKIKMLKSNIIPTENKKSVRESLRQIEFPHFGNILKVIRDQTIDDWAVFAHLEAFDNFLFDINQLYTRVGHLCEEIKR